MFAITARQPRLTAASTSHRRVGIYPGSGSPASRLYSSAWTPPIAVSDEVTLLKSTFQAYASRVGPLDHPSSPPIPTQMKKVVVPRLIAHIQDITPRTRRASHAMYAWRLGPGGPSDPATTPAHMMLYGSGNGGEAGAGSFLERLLSLQGSEDILLVVFRWYGGVKLGSDRWKCISSVATEALARGGFVKRLEGKQAPEDRRR